MRVLPTAAQKKAIKLAFGVARKAYNYANDRVRNGNERPNAQNLRKEWNNRKAEARLGEATTSSILRGFLSFFLLYFSPRRFCVDSCSGVPRIVEQAPPHARPTS